MRSIHLACSILILLALVGCTTLTGSSSTTKKTTPPPVGATTSSQSGNYYYDFDDVLIPKEMSLDADETFIMETTSEKVGVMVFDGRVERLSLTKRIIDNMTTNGWTMRSAFKSPRSILIFEKPGRFCIVSITDGHYTTHMEIWVAPSTGVAPAPPATTFAPGQPGAALEPPVQIQPLESLPEQGLTQ
ncbi:MAG: hypothetical protein AB7E47_05420 [Desulfovibrionaceae bacterium]